MANSIATGVAYADPQFDSILVDGAAVVNGGIVTTALIATGSAAAANNVAALYFLTTAITANVTTTSAGVGSLATTTNATGTGKLFISDGSKWQYPVVA